LVFFWQIYRDAQLFFQENQTGVESKRFKKGQYVSPGPRISHLYSLTYRMMEAIMDPKTWLFALFTALGNVPNRRVRSSNSSRHAAK
jgi:hypothetical protein